MAEDTRSAIRDIALELFARQGYATTSLREIAEKLGMTKAALYYHYPSKQALLQSIIEPLISEWKTVTDKATTLEHNSANIGLVLGECLDVLLGHRSIARMFARDAPAMVEAIGPFYQDLIDVHNRLHEWLAGPSATPADYIRSLAATEVLGAALGWTPMIAETPDVVVRAILLESATAVLRLS